MESIKIFDIRIDIINSKKINEKILNISRNNEKVIVSNVNINALNLAYGNERLKQFFNGAYINFIDGDGVNLGAKLLGLKTGSKVTYDWWIWEFGEFSESNKLSWYILGAKEESIYKAISKLKNAFPHLVIKGYHNGYFNKHSVENDQIINEINNLKPHILITAMGMPIQENWLQENWSNLNVNVALTGGSVIDYVSGYFKSTPEIFRSMKLEWFYRLIQDPKRLFKRYIFGNPLFIIRILKEKYF